MQSVMELLNLIINGRSSEGIYLFCADYISCSRGDSGIHSRTGDRFSQSEHDVGDEFCRSIAVMGEAVLIGFLFDDSDATDAGIACLFEGKMGRLLQTIHNQFPNEGDCFGWALCCIQIEILEIHDQNAIISELPVGGIRSMPNAIAVD